MEKHYWLQKWQSGQIAFHRAQVHPLLAKYFVKPVTGHVIVPLCGKSLDLVWLAAQGCRVLGVEWSEQACRDFFMEQNIDVQEREQADFRIFSGANIEIWCGDFFALPREFWRNCSLVYDRAALVAMPKDRRAAYVSNMLGNLKKQGAKDCRLLLVSFEYQANQVLGPPFSVSEDEVSQLFGADCLIRRAHRALEREIMDLNAKFSGVTVHESVYDMKLKSTIQHA